MNLFLQNPDTSFHLREIARLVGISPAGALKILKKLEKQGLVSKEKTKVTDNYLANVDNKEFVALKRASNLYSILNCGIIEDLAGKYLDLLKISENGIDFKRERYAATELNVQKTDPNAYDRGKITCRYPSDTNVLRMSLEYLPMDLAATGEYVERLGKK